MSILWDILGFDPVLHSFSGLVFCYKYIMIGPYPNNLFDRAITLIWGDNPFENVNDVGNFQSLDPIVFGNVPHPIYSLNRRTPL